MKTFEEYPAGLGLRAGSSPSQLNVGLPVAKTVISIST